MKLCLMILSVPWYMLNGLEHTAILSHILTCITGSSSRVSTIHTTFYLTSLLQIFSADLAMYWFPVCHFRCMKFKPLSDMENIAISTIVGTSSHIKMYHYNTSTICF